MMPAPAPSLNNQPHGWPIVGHDRAVQMLRRSIRLDRLSHAYLFTGPEGVGKRTLALALAMALNCQSDPPPGQRAPDVPCGLCPSCARIIRGTHPDVSEINLEKQTTLLGETGRGKIGQSKELKIDIIREMQAGIGLQPYLGRWKVYVVGDAERLNEEASNCLLKTLEEPPQHTILILLAPDDDQVLPTVASRCVRIALRPVPRAEVASNLVEVWSAEAERAETLAALSAGRPGYAVTLLTTQDNQTKRKTALQEVALVSGASVTERINRATAYAGMFTEARADLYGMLDVWEGWWRDVLLVGSSTSQFVTNVDQLPTLKSTAQRIPARQAAEAIALIQRTRRQLLENVNPRLALEALTLGLP